MKNEPLSAFLEACGAAEGLHLEVQAPEGGPTARRLLQPFALIGQDSEADVSLEDSAVGLPRHAYLQTLAGLVFCIDLGSRTGTSWATGPRPHGWLGPGEAVRVGSFQIRLLGGASASGGSAEGTNPVAPGSLGPGVVSPFLLEFLAANGQQAQWRLDRLVTLVGSDTRCKLQLRSRSISRHHCSLVHAAKQIWVVDLLSREGVFVNGAQVRCASLRDGDELRLGSRVLRFHQEMPFADQPGPASHPEVSALVTSRPAALPPPPPDGSASRAAPLVPPVLLPVPQPASAGSSLTVPLPHPPPALNGGVLEGANVSAANLSPLLSQFAQMQQQMFDQFQQTMGMMVQMFRALHQDQAAQVREELNRVQELTRELHTLQSELNRQKLSPQQTTGPAPLLPGVPLVTLGPPTPAPRSTAKVSLEKGEPPSPPGHAAAGRDGSRSATAGNGSRGANSVPKTAPAAPEDIHLWMFARMEEVQQERQARWQKILGFLTGGRLS